MLQQSDFFASYEFPLELNSSGAAYEYDPHGVQLPVGDVSRLIEKPKSDDQGKLGNTHE